MAEVFKVPLVLTPQPEGGYTVTSPVLPELITEGDTLEEAVSNVKDALEAVIETYEDLKRSHFLQTFARTRKTRRYGLKASLPAHEVPGGRPEAARPRLPGVASSKRRIASEVVQSGNRQSDSVAGLGREGSQAGHVACCRTSVRD